MYLMTTTSTAMRMLGTTDEVTVCDCCGRKDLKDTVAFEREDGQVMYFGCVCATRAMSWTTKEVRSSARAADKAKADAERAAREIAHKEEDSKWQSFLDAKASGPAVKGNRFLQIQSLGGYAAASTMFKMEAR
jgi:recombinational DNA repair protein (RecF pathway)